MVPDPEIGLPLPSFIATVPEPAPTCSVNVPGAPNATESEIATPVIEAAVPAVALMLDGFAIEGPVRRIPTTWPPSERSGNALAGVS